MSLQGYLSILIEELVDVVPVPILVAEVAVVTEVGAELPCTVMSHDCTYRRLSRDSCNSKKLHIFGTKYWNTMSNTFSVDSFKLGSIHIFRIGAAGVVGKCLRWVRVPKDAAPLLNSLIVVVGVQSSISRSMVNLHLGTVAVISGIHILNLLSPLCRGLIYFTLSAVGVPPSFRSSIETSSRYTRVDDSCSKEIRIGSSHDVLDCVLVFLMTFGRVKIIG